MEADIAPTLAERQQKHLDDVAARTQLAEWESRGGRPGEVWRSGDAVEGH